MRLTIVKYGVLVTAVAGLLFSAQKYAATQYKPLTNRLLAYPNAVPTLKRDRNIYRSTISATGSNDEIVFNLLRYISAYLPQEPIVARIAEEQGDIQTPHTLSSSSETKKPRRPKGEVDDTPTPPSTPKVQSPAVNAGIISQDVYKELYGDCIGCFGYVYPDGSIAGTYVAPNGQRYVIAVESTLQAANQFNQRLSEKLSNLSDSEILAIAQSNGTTTQCNPDDVVCQKNLINQTLTTLTQQITADRNGKIAEVVMTNKSLNDFMVLSDDELRKKYGTTDISQIVPNLPPDQYTLFASEKQKYQQMISQAEVSTSESKIGDKTVYTSTSTLKDPITGEVVSTRTFSYTIETLTTKEKTDDGFITHETTVFRDPSTNQLLDATALSYIKKTTTETRILPGGRGSIDENKSITYEKTTIIDAETNQLLQESNTSYTSGVLSPESVSVSQTSNTYTPEGNKITTRQHENVINQQVAASRYADPRIPTSELARSVCGSDDRDCQKNFERDDYLNILSDKNLVNESKLQYQQNLIDLTKVIGTPLEDSLPQVVKNTVKSANAEIEHAFWVYIKDNQNRQHSAQGTTTDQLAREFQQKLKSDPGSLDNYLTRYYQNSADYQPTGNTFKFDQEPNALVIVEYKDIIASRPISGLFDGNKPLDYDQLSIEYKNQVRDIACQQDESLMSLCRKYKNQISRGTPLSADQVETYQAYREELAQELDSRIKTDSGKYVEKIIDTLKGSSIELTTYGSNLATVDNPLVDKALREAAIKHAYTQETQSNLPLYMRESHYNKNYLGPSENKLNEVANQYLDKQLVTETYKVGGGMAAGFAGFAGGAALGAAGCAATGVGIVASPICAIVGGVVGGAAAWGASQVPLYELTAQQYEEQKQSVASIVGGNQMAASIIQSTYSNTGAWGDEGAGRSITTRDNQFALLDSIGQVTGGFSINELSLNDEFNAQVAMQGQILNGWEANQNMQERWTWYSLPVSAVTGGLNAGLGNSLATNLANRSLSSASFTANRVLAETITFGASGATNWMQADFQFNDTQGNAVFLTTPGQVAYQSCVQESSADQCADKLAALKEETDANRKAMHTQAVVTDTLTQIYQTVSSARNSSHEFNQILANANEMGIPTSGRSIGEIQNDLTNSIKLSAAEKLNIPDVENKSPQELTLAITSAEALTVNQENLAPHPDDVSVALALEKELSKPKAAQEKIVDSAKVVGELLSSNKAVQIESEGKPRLSFTDGYKPTFTEETSLNELNNIISNMEEVSKFSSLRDDQVEATLLSLNELNTLNENNSKNELLVDTTTSPGINPNAGTGKGKTTVIVPILEKATIDSGKLVLHIAPETNMAGNRKSIENLRAFYDTDIYVAVSEKDANGTVINRFFTNLDGNKVPTDQLINRINTDSKAPLILADADTAMFGLNEVIKIDRGLTKSDAINDVWAGIWNANPTVTADEVGTLAKHWSSSIGDPVEIGKLRKSEASLNLSSGKELLKIFEATGELTIVKLAREGEIELSRDPVTRSLKPLDDQDANEVINKSLNAARNDRKIPRPLADALDRIINIEDFTQKRKEFDSLRALTPRELDETYGKNASHAMAVANAYNDAIYSRLSIMAAVPGNDYKLVKGQDGSTIELASSKTVNGQQYSEVMLRLALQEEGARILKVANTDLRSLDQLTVSSQSLVVSLDDMFKRAGQVVGYDATEGFASAATGLKPIYEGTPLHKAESVSLASNLKEISRVTASHVREQFDQGKTALVIETNVDFESIRSQYDLDMATSSHVTSTLETLKPGEKLILALADGDGSYKLYQVEGEDRSLWKLITDTSKSAEELYVASRDAIDKDPKNNRLLALFENKTRGENFKPATGLATDIQEAIVIGNHATSKSDIVQQAAGRLRTDGIAPPYRFVDYVSNDATYRSLLSSDPESLPQLVLKQLASNQKSAEGAISLQRNIKAINTQQLTNLVNALYSDASNNPKLKTILFDLDSQIRNSGLAFETTPALEKTANVLHDQYLFTRGRIENILKIAADNGVPNERITQLRKTFNLDEPSLTLGHFQAMLDHTYSNSDVTGYHKALVRNIGTFENVPETYLAGSPTEPVLTIVQAKQAQQSRSILARLSNLFRSISSNNASQFLNSNFDYITKISSSRNLLESFPLISMLLPNYAETSSTNNFVNIDSNSLARSFKNVNTVVYPNSDKFIGKAKTINGFNSRDYQQAFKDEIRLFGEPAGMGTFGRVYRKDGIITKIFSNSEIQTDAEEGQAISPIISADDINYLQLKFYIEMHGKGLVQNIVAIITSLDGTIIGFQQQEVQNVISNLDVYMRKNNRKIPKESLDELVEKLNETQNIAKGLGLSGVHGDLIFIPERNGLPADTIRRRLNEKNILVVDVPGRDYPALIPVDWHSINIDLDSSEELLSLRQISDDILSGNYGKALRKSKITYTKQTMESINENSSTKNTSASPMLSPFIVTGQIIANNFITPLLFDPIVRSEILKWVNIGPEVAKMTSNNVKNTLHNSKLISFTSIRINEFSVISKVRKSFKEETGNKLPKDIESVLRLYIRNGNNFEDVLSRLAEVLYKMESTEKNDFIKIYLPKWATKGVFSPLSIINSMSKIHPELKKQLLDSYLDIWLDGDKASELRISDLVEALDNNYRISNIILPQINDWLIKSNDYRRWHRFDLIMNKLNENPDSIELTLQFINYFWHNSDEDIINVVDSINVHKELLSKINLDLIRTIEDHQSYYISPSDFIFYLNILDNYPSTVIKYAKYLSFNLRYEPEIIKALSMYPETIEEVSPLILKIKQSELTDKDFNELVFSLIHNLNRLDQMKRTILIDKLPLLINSMKTDYQSNMINNLSSILYSFGKVSIPEIESAISLLPNWLSKGFHGFDYDNLIDFLKYYNSLSEDKRLVVSSMIERTNFSWNTPSYIHHYAKIVLFNSSPSDFTDLLYSIFPDGNFPSNYTEELAVMLNKYPNRTKELISYFLNIKLDYDLQLDVLHYVNDRDPNLPIEQIIAEYISASIRNNNLNIVLTNLANEQVLSFMDPNIRRFWETVKNYPLLNNRWLKEDGLEFFFSLSEEKLRLYAELSEEIDNSPVGMIQKIKDTLILELFNTPNPKNSLKLITKVLVKNNLPFYVKLRRVFDYLYSEHNLGLILNLPKTSPMLKQTKADGMRRFLLQRDLFRAAVESGNYELYDYLTNLKSGMTAIDKIMSGNQINNSERSSIIDFINKMDSWYQATNLHRVRESLILDLDKVKNDSYLRSFINDTLYSDLKVTTGVLSNRIEDIFLFNSGYKSIDEILEHMSVIRIEASNRNLTFASEHPTFAFDEADIMKGIIFSEDATELLSVLQDGPRAREFMGEYSSSDLTPLDTDVSYVLPEHLLNGFNSTMQMSLAKGYGKLIFVTKNLPGRFYRSDQGQTEEKGSFELFETLKSNQYGVRGAYPSTYFDAIILNGYKEKDLETLYSTILLNGFYIPVYSEKGDLIFTPSMYQERVKFFKGTKSGLYNYNALAKNDRFNQLIELYRFDTNLDLNKQDITRVEKPIVDKLSEVLSNYGVTLATNSKDATLADAVLMNTGSSGRGTNLPKDYDFDYILMLNRRDINNANQIASAIKAIFPHSGEIPADMSNGHIQIRLEGVELDGYPEKISLDIGINLREDILLYASHQAVIDRITDLNLNDKNKVIANILLAKKLLKDGHAYKKFEDGGMGGIGVENWILSNNGNIRDAFESFWRVAHDSIGNVIPIAEFKKLYPIYDPGINLKSKGFDNYIYKLSDTGYSNMLKVIDIYLHNPPEIERVTPYNIGKNLGEQIIDLAN